MWTGQRLRTDYCRCCRPPWPCVPCVSVNVTLLAISHQATIFQNVFKHQITPYYSKLINQKIYLKGVALTDGHCNGDVDARGEGINKPPIVAHRCRGVLSGRRHVSRIGSSRGYLPDMSADWCVCVSPVKNKILN